MKTKIPKYYWDSSVFISWLNGMKDRCGDEKEGAHLIKREIDLGKAVLVISSSVRYEVLQAFLTPDAETKFKKFLGRSNVQEFALDHIIADRAREIRDYYKKGNPTDKTVGGADAAHLATAIHAKVDEFHTYDEKKKTNIGLLSLNGSVAGYPLVIVKPGTNRTMELPLDETRTKEDRE